MSKICPGQNMQFWGPQDVFEIRCGYCGSSVEFFKDDGSRRCGQCGKRVQNPKVNLGCAQWCEHAKECLGFDPKSVEMSSEDISLADKIIGAMKQEFGDDKKRIAHALSVLGESRELIKKIGGDPRVVIAASVLHDIGIQEAERKHGSSAPRYQELEGPPIARRILEEMEFDSEAIDHVCRIVGSHHTGGDIDTPEFRVVWDADLLVNLIEDMRSRNDIPLAGNVLNRFLSDSGREEASIVLKQVRDGGAGDD